MNILGYQVPKELVVVMSIVFGVLTVCSVIFRILAKRKPSKMLTELIVRTNSWWFIAIGVAAVVIGPAILGTILVGYVSFVALREMLSISRFREADRSALFASYFAIPIQYYLAYKGYYEQFLYFIPLIMFIGIPVILVLTGKTKRIGVSMSLIPTMLMLTTYMLSHLILLFSLNVPDNSAGAGGLIIFLIMCTSFNDVFQFTWGKLMGQKKILPNVSPNKTWAGFLGGILTTSILGYCLQGLTPLTGQQALICGFILGVMGFLGDSIISAIKRDLQLKDTDDLIPGHGGAMDRLDSIILTTPVFYHMLRFFIAQ